MFEESVESFVSQWRPYAADVTLFTQAEGSPLLECQAGGAIFGVLARTGPYSAVNGPAQLIVHLMTEQVTLSAGREQQLEVLGPSRLRATGLVVLRQGRMVVVNAGAPLVVGSFGALPEGLTAGDWVEVSGLPPVHGFVIPKTVRRTLTPADSGI